MLNMYDDNYLTAQDPVRTGRALMVLAATIYSFASSQVRQCQEGTGTVRAGTEQPSSVVEPSTQNRQPDQEDELIIGVSSTDLIDGVGSEDDRSPCRESPRRRRSHSPASQGSRSIIIEYRYKSDIVAEIPFLLHPKFTHRHLFAKIRATAPPEVAAYLPGNAYLRLENGLRPINFTLSQLAQSGRLVIPLRKK